MANVKDDSGIYHLTVGTEVSAKYRGAFCEAKIKIVKKNVLYKVVSKKTGKSSHLAEESVNGILKIGSTVQALFPEQTEWQEGTIQNAKDRSSYTVIFDDGDERTLSRGSLCLKGDRHYAKSETLDNLPLTDPENFGTPVLAMKKSRRRRPVEDEYDDESEDQKTPDREKPKDENKKKTQDESDKQESSSEEEEDDDEKRKRWLTDPMMGKVVIVEPNDKRKHWFPGLVVNPLCYERHQNLATNHIVVRSFKTGKFLRVNRSSVKEMTANTIPTKLDSVWKDIVSDAQNWQNTRVVSDRWRIDIKDILSDSEDDESSDEDKNEKTKKKSEKDEKEEENDETKDKEEEKKSHDFLEVLYKFMDDRGTPINKTPVLGYKDLDLYLLYGLVEQRQGALSIKSIKDWKQIYLDLGIPKPNPAAGYNVRTAYAKYLGAYEEYCMSWKHLPLPVKKPPKSSGMQNSASKDKKKMSAKIKEEPAEKIVKKETDKISQEKRKIKSKDKESIKTKSLDSNMDGKTRGRSSPTIVADLKALSQQRRTAQRRRASESSSASDVTTSSNKSEKKKATPKSITSKKTEDRFRSPGGPDSEPDDSSRSVKTEKKESGEKRSADKNISESAALKRIRRNSTSNVSTQYVQGDRLKVKYGQGKTFKIYDAKVLQVKPPEGPGEVTEYLVHYQGWNARHDEIIKPHRIVGLADERSIPQSPSSHTKSPRRPKTPNSSRLSSSSKDDITPSPGLSIELSKRFCDTDLSHITDELPSFTSKPRVPHGLKKNLTEDLIKSARNSETAKSATYGNRSTSPVLSGSQRTKRSKSPQIFTDLHTSPVLARSKSIEKPANSKEKSNGKSSSAPEKDSSKKSNDDKSNTVTKVESESTQNEASKRPASPAIKKSRSDEAKEKDDDSNSSTGSIIDESATKVELSEDNSDENQEDVTTPVQQPRRTSTRRSKSPAYLSDSWYPKRRKFSTSNEKTPSPVPPSISESPPEKPSTPTLCKPLVAATRKSQRSPSPSLSTSSSNSTNSGESELTAKEKSPILLSSATSQSSASTKSRDKSKSKGTKSQEKPKSEMEAGNDKNNNNKTKLPENIEESKVEGMQTSEYDNFDEEAPSIALEKHKKSRQSLSRSNDKRKQPIDPTEIISVKDEKEGIEIGQVESLVHEREVKVSAARKNEERNSESNRRKIRKRKSANNVADQNDAPKSPKVEKIEADDKVESPANVNPTTSSNTQQENEIPTVTSDNNNIANEGQQSSSSINHENAPVNNTPSHNLTTLPQNPPSSSKSLLENTPPTTPEQSPTHVSEDQDMEIDNKHSPTMLDSDAMDIGEEHKESMENTSSSGNEQATYSGKSPTGKDNKKEDEDKQDDNTQTPSSKKKQRGRKKRTNQKNRHTNRRMSCGNEKDSESEDEADNETGESTRKRHDSGKQRKKRAKARPEPPTAPPPLPREKLESMSQDERIALLQSRMAEMRKVYHQLKQEVANIDRKRKRAKRREREAAEAAQSISKQAQSSPFPASKASNVTGNKIENGTPAPVTSVQAASEGDDTKSNGQSV